MKRIRVLIVEDSTVVREFLRQIISADSRFEVVEAVPTAEQALAILDRAAPDVISLDIRLPGMQGFEATRRIMSMRPTPIVVVSASGQLEEIDLTMEALRAGALSVVEKPTATTRPDYETLANRLCTQLAIMSQVKVVKQRFDEPSLLPFYRDESAPRSRTGYRLLSIAASTGGPAALMHLLCGLGGNFPLPIVVVQHMTPGFLDGFGSWLAGVAPFEVEVVGTRTKLSSGKCYLAPADQHLRADANWAWPESGAPVRYQRPSGSVLFSSIAETVGKAGIGVLLTGMGDDGADGLLAMRRAGAYTIAEDESTAVVYGMPAAGVQLGAAREVLPLPEIAPRILELLRTAPEEL